MLHHRASSHDMNSVLGQTRTEKCHQLQTTGRSCCGFTCRTFLGSLKRTNSLLTRRELQQSQAQGEQPSPVTGWSEGRKTLLRTRCRDKADTHEPNLFSCSTVKSYTTLYIYIKQNCGWVDVISKETETSRKEYVVDVFVCVFSSSLWVVCEKGGVKTIEARSESWPMGAWRQVLNLLW